MDDPELAVLRLRAHAAGLGVDWSRADDHAVLDFIAWAAPVADTGAPALQRLTPKLELAAAPPPPASPRRQAPASAAAAPAAAGPDIDAAAMAQTLRAAARDGVPFCEECARAAAARAAA